MTETLGITAADRTTAGTRLSAPELARQQGMNPVDYLRQRGFIHDISDEAGLRQAFDDGTVTYYIGFDPTGPSLHAGHMVGIMLLASLQRMGHRPIALGGGGTAMVGDPTGKTVSREIIRLEDLEANLQAISGQLAKYLDFTGNQFAGGNPPAMLVNNADWLLELRYIPFLRDIGRHFSVNEMLSLETYKTRIESGNGLNFVEFNYRLVQAYDFLHLFREEGCTLQMGGSDQWANITGGVELIRKADQGKAFALVSPLVTTASGEKMGKTGSGVRVWLDPEQFSPYDYYQYWVNTDDAQVETYLNRFTFLPTEEIAELTSVSGEALREAKRVLAFEATALAHGVEEAQKAEHAAKALFSGHRRFSTTAQNISPRERELREYLQSEEFLESATNYLGNASPERLAELLVPSGKEPVGQSSVTSQDEAATPSKGSTVSHPSPLAGLFSNLFEEQLRQHESLSTSILKAAGYEDLGKSISTVAASLSGLQSIPKLTDLIDWRAFLVAPDFSKVLPYPSTDLAEVAQSMTNDVHQWEASDRFLPTTEIPAAEVADLTLADAFVRAELAKGRGEARRLAAQGGLSVDDVKIEDVDVPLADALAGRDAAILRAGKKRFKRIALG